MADKGFLKAPKPPPDFVIPPSLSSVEVRVIDTGTLLKIDPKLFWTPDVHSLPEIHAPIYCFLITHRGLDKHVVFDLGLRADWCTYAPKVVSLIAATTTVTQGLDVAAVLDNDVSGLNVRSTDIESVIWSHNHFDHTGDPATFPASTELVVGPGVKSLSWPGYPTVDDAAVLDSDSAGRTVREISFDGDGAVKIANFDAYDFFGDGSFYLLDAPGHALGHMCGLARTTVEPASFVFMGADACHHAGLLRPTEHQPLPQEIEIGFSSATRNATGNKPRVIAKCPGDLLQQIIPGQRPDAPFFEVAKTIVCASHDEALQTVKKIHELDAREDVFAIISHDLSLRDKIPLFPKSINAWMDMGLGRYTRWLFCNDFQLKNRSSQT